MAPKRSAFWLFRSTHSRTASAVVGSPGGKVIEYSTGVFLGPWVHFNSKPKCSKTVFWCRSGGTIGQRETPYAIAISIQTSPIRRIGCAASEHRQKPADELRRDRCGTDQRMKSTMAESILLHAVA